MQTGLPLARRVKLRLHKKNDRLLRAGHPRRYMKKGPKTFVKSNALGSANLSIAPCGFDRTGRRGSSGCSFGGTS